MAGVAAARNFSAASINGFRKIILEWYDRHRRTLPWRAPPGRRMDPYHVWLSEVMLQQTTVAAVMAYFVKFTGKWPRVADLAAAPVDDVMQAWAGLGYYARARNLHKCAKVVADELKGRFPDNQDDLRALPGIGDYTSAAIAAIAFDKPATVIDGNVERVIARMFDIRTPLPNAKKPIREYATRISEGREDRPGDFAQAMMDLGATICIPKAPRCSLCPVTTMCEGYKNGTAPDLPARKPKAEKPKRIGYAYIVRDARGRILIERRAESGLLGGMNAFPTSEWIDDKEGAKIAHPAFLKPYAKMMTVDEGASIRHVFTHFDLTLIPVHVRLDDAGKDVIPASTKWRKMADLPDIGFPSVFKKIERMAVQKTA